MPNATEELKLDGYALQDVKAGGKVILYSRRGIDLTKRFPYVARALASLPDDTVIDGELIALDEEGKPNVNLLQNFRSAESHIVFYALGVLIHTGHDLENSRCPSGGQFSRRPSNRAIMSASRMSRIRPQMREATMSNAGLCRIGYCEPC